MIQLDILSGQMAGTRWVARRLPLVVGRKAGSALVLQDDGVWDSHFELAVRPGEGVFLTPGPDAVCLVNHQRVQQPERLRNGDLIEAGSVKLRFGFAPSGQRSVAAREVLTWCAIGLLCLAQIALIYLYLP